VATSPASGRGAALEQRPARIALYAGYRTIKDGPAPAARTDAHAFIFGALAKLIEKRGRA
jgi:hypothetical protein